MLVYLVTSAPDGESDANGAVLRVHQAHSENFTQVYSQLHMIAVVHMLSLEVVQCVTLCCIHVSYI